MSGPVVEGAVDRVELVRRLHRRRRNLLSVYARLDGAFGSTCGLSAPEMRFSLGRCVPMVLKPTPRWDELLSRICWICRAGGSQP